MKYAEGIGNDSRLTEGTRLSGCLILELYHAKFIAWSRGVLRLFVEFYSYCLNLNFGC